jgi:hypothetical protein
MPISDFNPNFVPEHMLEDARRGSLGPSVPTAQEVIARGGVPATWHCCHVDADPRWLGSQVACRFEAPLGSKAQARHTSAHAHKPTAEERRRAEIDEANRRAIYATSIECGCGRVMKPGDPPHACNGVRETGPTSIDVAAAAFKRQGLREALADLGEDE